MSDSLTIQGEMARRIRNGWLDGKPSAEATAELLQTIRTGSPVDASELTVKLRNEGVAPQSICDGLFNGAAELLMQAPGIFSLHATTFTNAVHSAWQRVYSDETRRLLLLQNAASCRSIAGTARRALFTSTHSKRLTRVPRGDEAVAEIFADVSEDRLTAARKILAYLKQHPNPRPLADAARRLIFLKGTNAHD